MREIKFRAWDKTRNKMCNDISLAFLSNYNNNLNGFFEHNAIKTGLEIMQFIGLKDKNGKEIYEGDVLMDESDGHPCFIVKYLLDDEHSCFALFNWVTDNPRDKWWWFETYSPKYMEVIGNIYENPELLTQ